MSRERDDLMQKLKERPTQVVYKDRHWCKDVLVAPADNGMPAAIATAPM